MSAILSRRAFITHAGALTIAADRQLLAVVNPITPATQEPEEVAEEWKGDVPLAPPDKQPPHLKLPETPKRKIGYAIVGIGELALEQILPAFGASHLSRPVALVSGHRDKALKVASAYQIEQDAIYGYEDYDALADDKRVDVIYIALPNSMHAEYTIRGLRAGKHVLCEKPMAASPAEAEAMIRAAREHDRKLMVAYRLHYEPLNQRVMEMCGKQQLGRILTFASSNCQNVKAPNIRLSRELAGGPLGDLGIYSVNAARYVIGEEPVEVTAIAHSPSDDPRFREVPESVAFTLRYPSGVLAHCDCSFGSMESRSFKVHCAKGVIQMDPAFSYTGLKLQIKSGSAAGGVEQGELMIPHNNHFASEMDHFSTCILENKEPHTPGELGLKDMRILAALEKSAAADGRPVNIS